MARPFALSGPLSFQRLVLLQHALTLPILRCQIRPGAINVALDLHTAIHTAPRPRGL